MTSIFASSNIRALQLVFVFVIIIMFFVIVFWTYNRIINWALVLTKLRPKILMIFFFVQILFWGIIILGP
jgi:hypothetical protein